MPNGLVFESHLNTRQPNIVDVGLLLNRLKIMGLPGDVTGLNEVWLRERFFIVSTNGSMEKLGRIVNKNPINSVLHIQSFGKQEELKISHKNPQSNFKCGKSSITCMLPHVNKDRS